MSAAGTAQPGPTIVHGRARRVRSPNRTRRAARKEEARRALLSRLVRVVGLAAEARRQIVEAEVSSDLAEAGTDGFAFLWAAAARGDRAAQVYLSEALRGAALFAAAGGSPTLREWLGATEVDRGALVWASKARQ